MEFICAWNYVVNKLLRIDPEKAVSSYREVYKEWISCGKPSVQEFIRNRLNEKMKSNN